MDELDLQRDVYMKFENQESFGDYKRILFYNTKPSSDNEYTWCKRPSSSEITSSNDSRTAFIKIKTSASENEIYYQNIYANIVFPESYECNLKRKSRKHACDLVNPFVRRDGRYTNLIESIRHKQKCENCLNNKKCYCKDGSQVLLTTMARNFIFPRELENRSQFPKFRTKEKLEKSVGKTIINTKQGSLGRKTIAEHSDGKHQKDRDKNKYGRSKETGNKRRKEVKEEMIKPKKIGNLQNKAPVNNTSVGVGNKELKNTSDRSTELEEQVQENEKMLTEYKTVSDKKDHSTLENKEENQVGDHMVSPCECIEKNLDTSSNPFLKLKVQATDPCSSAQVSKAEQTSAKYSEICICGHQINPSFGINKELVVHVLDKFIEEVERLKREKCRCKKLFVGSQIKPQVKENNIFEMPPMLCYSTLVSDRALINDGQKIYFDQMRSLLGFKHQQIKRLECPVVLQFDSRDEECLNEALTCYFSNSPSCFVNKNVM